LFHATSKVSKIFNKETDAEFNDTKTRFICEKRKMEQEKGGELKVMLDSSTKNCFRFFRKINNRLIMTSNSVSIGAKVSRVYLNQATELQFPLIPNLTSFFISWFEFKKQKEKSF
jgi:hypothetical protein